MNLADTALYHISQGGYRTPLSYDDYIWGSHAIACNYAINLAYAYSITKINSYGNKLKIEDYKKFI